MKLAFIFASCQYVESYPLLCTSFTLYVINLTCLMHTSGNGVSLQNFDEIPILIAYKRTVERDVRPRLFKLNSNWSTILLLFLRSSAVMCYWCCVLLLELLWCRA